MFTNKLSRLLGVALLLALVVLPAHAQNKFADVLQVTDQLSLDGTVMVNQAVVEVPAFLAIHAESDDGSFGETIGFTPLSVGSNTDVRVAIDPALAEPGLWAVLHADDNEIGVYEFGEVEDADAPLTIEDEPIAVPFKTQMLLAADQIVTDNQVSVAHIILSEPSWLVIHSGDLQTFGEPVGQTFVQPGSNHNITVEIDPKGRTDVLWPMIHEDTGTPAAYEFGTVENADLPLVVLGTVATMPILTFPNIRMAPEPFVLSGNGVITGDTASVTVESVLSDGPGFLVIYNDSDGNLGDAIGFTPVEHGLNTNAVVEIDGNLITPTLWTELHTDDNTVGEMEFGTVEGADLPVTFNDQPVNQPRPVATYMRFHDQPLVDNTITIDQVWSPGAQAFVVVHADDGSGEAGEYIGFTPVNGEMNTNVVVQLDPQRVTDTLFVMLHTDTGTVGTFEFGTVEGADRPIMLNNQVMVGSLNLTGETAAAPPSQPEQEGVCTLTINADITINLRSGPGTNFDIARTLTIDQSVDLNGQTQGEDGFTWWRTTDNFWLRSDAVTAPANCANLPGVQA